MTQYRHYGMAKQSTQELKCVYFCTSRQVSADNILPVVRYCVGKNSGKKLVSYKSTCKRLVPEMRELSKLQLGDVLKCATERTLEYDGTRKKRPQYGEVQIAMTDNTFTVGIKEMGRGDADSYVEAITASIDSISETCRQPQLRKDILENVSNTMTDRHAVNKCVNRKLGDKIENEEINNFYCAMQPLDTFAKTADKTIRYWEEKRSLSTTTMSFKKRMQCSICSLFRHCVVFASRPEQGSNQKCKHTCR